jgi:hypothetical protein
VSELSPEDAKLIILARATRARTGAADGAAVRDRDGRTYAAATVELPSLRLSALQVCVAMAVASAGNGVEAAVVLTAAGAIDPESIAAVAEFGGGGTTVHRADSRGDVVESVTI